MQTIELLAPARDLTCGLAAIDSGADAVYIGAPRFSARSAAHNTLQDIETLVRRAHLFGARIYVALNTILYDSEIDDAVRLIWDLYRIGADAVIIQDMGLLECALPPIALHASTQCNNRTPQKVQFLQSVGFGQVVLARELDLEQIRSISSQASVPLEYFVHGALCVSYSGQCYISQAKALRSANRGDCSQFCRHSYTLTDSAGKTIARDRHLLSLRDLDLSHRLEDLIDAGISSFKIEGRLKDAAYVKNTTTHYRRQLDEILARRPELRRASIGRVSAAYSTDLSKTFNRGQSRYFLDGRSGDLVCQLSPKHVGEPVGTVAQVQGRRIRLSAPADLANGDGLAYFDPRGALVGVRLSRIDGPWLEFNTDTHITAGTALYRNYDIRFDKQLSAGQPLRQIAASLRLYEQAGSLRLSAADEQGYTADTPVHFAMQQADQPDKAMHNTQAALSKAGGSLFYIQQVQIDLPHACFFPASVLNDARRAVLQQLQDARAAGYRPETRPAAEGTVPYPAQVSSYMDNISNALARQFYQRHGLQVEEMAYECQRPEGERPLMVTRYCIKYELGMCPRHQHPQPHSWAEPFFLHDGAHRFRLVFDCKRCEMEVWG